MNPTKIIKAAATAWRVRHDWLGDGGTPVAPELAQERANVCLKCPFNREIPIYELFSAFAAQKVKQQVALKSELQMRVNGDNDLHVCNGKSDDEGCLCVLKLKVWVPIQYISNSDGIVFHPSCWILAEQQKQNLQHDNESSRIQKQ